MDGQQCSNPDVKNSFWEIAHNHYQDPILKSLVDNWARPEGNRAWSDVGWGTLTHNYAGATDITPPAIPTGVSVQ